MQCTYIGLCISNCLTRQLHDVASKRSMLAMRPFKNMTKSNFKGVAHHLLFSKLQHLEICSQGAVQNADDTLLLAT